MSTYYSKTVVGRQDYSNKTLSTPKSSVVTEYNRKFPNFGTVKVQVPNWILDKVADETISQGYSKKKNPVCDVCHEQRSVSGNCSC